MARDKQKSDNLCTALIIFALVTLLLSCYWQAAPVLSKYGLTNSYVNNLLRMLYQYFSQPVKLKSFIYLLILCSSAFRMGKAVDEKWSTIFAYTIAGGILFFICPKNGIVYTMTGLSGFILSIFGLSMITRKLKNKGEAPDEDEGFMQNTEHLVNDMSVNIPYEFVYQKKKYKGEICVLQPQRASLVMGSPGSGKSFVFYNAFIEQQLRKGYTMFLYDYKFPDLTERVLTEIAYQAKYENLWADMKQKPHLYIINFDDALRSNRCNPIKHTYITDPADTTEIADLVFLNINKGSEGKGFDFFNESAKVYLDGLIWYLANYDPDALYDDPIDPQKVTGSKTNYKNKGCYCTFPHVIEMMAYNYQKVFQILQFTKGLEAKISPFSSALEGGAMEQLQGQIASAQIPMGKFVSPALYWVMSGDDFTLDINNPEDPKIVCMGNNPDRQTIYGTTLALYTSRMFKLINHKHKLKSTILLDELPTIFLKGLDNIIATARSNKVCLLAGCQDKSQLYRDYGQKEADVIMTTVGNVFSGSVEGRTAEDLSKAFGKKELKRVSTSLSEDSESHSISYQDKDILPSSKITHMTQGYFCGWVKDMVGQEIKEKRFYGKMIIDMNRNKALDKVAQKVPVITNIFGEQMPEMPLAEKEKINLMHPEFKGDEKMIYKEFINGLVLEEVNRNFEKIKLDVKTLVEAEYRRTAPIAEQYKAENGIEN